MIKSFKTIFMIIAFTLIFFASVSLAAEEKKDSQPVKESQVKNDEVKYDIGDFEYKSEGTRDPFEPVLMNKVKEKRTVMVDKSKKAVEEKKGYELEELRLVGVLKSDKGMMAMMENTQGEGIFYRKGDPLNNRLGMWVADISDSNVVFAYKLKGEIKKVVVDLPTKK